MSYLKHLIHLVRTPSVIFHVLLITQLMIFLALVFRPFSLIPEGSVYTIIDKNFFYPNLILQGKEGAWRMLDTHTTLFSPYIFAYTFFIALGKIAAVFNLNVVWVYLFARIVCGIAAFYTTLWFITHVVPKKYQVVGLLLVLGIETGPLLSALPELKTLFEGRVMIIRHFGLPHHMFAHATGMLFIGLLMLCVQKPTPARIFGMFFSGLISTISMPAYTFTFALTAFPSWVVWAFFSKTLKRLIPPLLLGSIIILAPNLLFALEFTKGPPWTNSTPNEKTWFTTEYVRMEYISTLLFFVPFLILFFILLPFMWKKIDIWLKQLIILMTSWVIGPLLWVAAAKTAWFPMPNHRLTDSYGFLPAGILAAMGIHFCISLIPNMKWRIVLGTVLVSLAFVPSIYFSALFTKQLFKAQEHADYHIYPSKDLWDGIQFMSTLPKMTGVMVREQFGEVIPAFANVRIYVGGIHNYPDWLERQYLSYRFFSGEMASVEVSEFLKKSDISYVFYGPDEQAANTTGTLYPTMLTPVFSNTAVTVFKVEK